MFAFNFVRVRVLVRVLVRVIVIGFSGYPKNSSGRV